MIYLNRLKIFKKCLYKNDKKNKSLLIILKKYKIKYVFF